jgi:hypothetical protein
MISFILTALFMSLLVIWAMTYLAIEFDRAINESEREGERKRSDGYTQHPCIKCKEDTLVWQNTVSDWICESCGEWEGGD